MIVVDASALIELLLGGSNAAAIKTRMSGERLHAPHLVDVEVIQVIRRLEMHGTISAARGRDALTDHAGMMIRRYPHVWLMAAAWRLRNNITAYDAMYVALAETLGAPLLTHDGRLASAAGSIVSVELI